MSLVLMPSPLKRTPASKVLADLSRHARLIELIGMLIVLYSWTLNLDGFETYRAAQDDLRNLVAQMAGGQAERMRLGSAQLAGSSPANSEQPRDAAAVPGGWLEYTMETLLALSGSVTSLQELHSKYDVPRERVDTLRKALDSTAILLRSLAEPARAGRVPNALTPARAEEIEKAVGQQAKTLFALVAKLEDALLAKRARNRALYRYAFICGTLLLALGKFFDWRSSLKVATTE
jgi:hypothetical protein